MPWPVPGLHPQSMRNNFKTWCSETQQPRELAEQARAHANPNRVEAADMRSVLFERRRVMTESWTDYLFQPKAIASVGSRLSLLHRNERPQRFRRPRSAAHEARRSGSRPAAKSNADLFGRQDRRALRAARARTCGTPRTQAKP